MVQNLHRYPLEVRRKHRTFLWVASFGQPSMSFPDLYLEGLRLFNEEEFFECHEVLEELWTNIHDDSRKFYKGLIQASVSLFHFGNGNLGGARKVYLSSRKYLEAYGPEYQGLNLEKFLAEMAFCFEELTSSHETYPDHVVLRDERIPKIDLPA